MSIKGTYSPASLSDPKSITYTATKKVQLQIFVFLDNLVTGNTIDVSRYINKFGYDSKNYTDPFYGSQDDPASVDYTIGLDPGDSVVLTLDLKAGSLVTVDYEIWTSRDD